ncbi:protein tyrosine kinase, partial [Nakamurella silvestris]
MELQSYLRALRRSWWLVAVCFFLAIGGGIFVTLRTPPMYQSSVTFFVQTPSETSALQGDTFGQKRVNSYVQLASSQRLAEMLIADTGLNLTPAQVSSRISASGDLNTVIMTVKVTDSIPSRGLQIATSISTQFVDLVSAMEKPAAGGLAPVRLEVVSGPTLNSAQVSPQPFFNMTLAALIGLAIGIGAALLREFMDTSVRNVDTLQEAAGTPVIGVIGFDESARKSPLIIDSSAKSNRAESFRQLRTNLQFVDVDQPPRVVVVTSAIPDEGKSSTSTNLAIT